MILILFCCLLIYGIGGYFSPYPYWKTYFILWKTLLFHKEPGIGIKPRIKQAAFLLKYAVFCPLWAFLWLLDDILYSEYKNINIRPVFIMGQPRSGTTFLHRTLASDTKNFLAIRHIEWRFPFIFVQKILSRSSIARKLVQKNYWSNSSAGRIASKMHPNKLSDWEEDGIFYEECFLHHFFVFLRFPYPHLLTYLDDFPALPDSVQDKILQVHNQVIQKIMFLRGDNEKYYLSKEVTSHNKFPSILKRYPDAKFIFSFRSSVDFMNSLISLVRVSTKSKIGVDPMDIASWDRIFQNRMQKDSEFLIELCKEKIENRQQIKIMFNRFTKDLVASIEYVYSKLDFNLPQPYRSHLETLQQGQKNRDRGYDYETKTYKNFDKFDQFVNEIDLEFEENLEERTPLEVS
ncbi:sulfotransferase [Desulfobacula phenolica]|uniref:Sulfotransferase family protein n=1 Tax=Desulfobacula phenolica TaxID=90732 RepID=A0A1H2DND6_9BACT|nr:sulfotransferase [Desulfobacula phenolica]SDT84447.1 Sulfotransferase family protein [Desulfobacula phenolica]